MHCSRGSEFSIRAPKNRFRKVPKNENKLIPRRAPVAGTRSSSIDPYFATAACSIAAPLRFFVPLSRPSRPLLQRPFRLGHLPHRRCEDICRIDVVFRSFARHIVGPPPNADWTVPRYTARMERTSRRLHSHEDVEDDDAEDAEEDEEDEDYGDNEKQ